MATTDKTSLYAKLSLNILLLGKTGNGKSSIGNSILGEELFECDSLTESVTKDVQHGTTNFKNWTLKVVDAPGVEDTENLKDLEKSTETMIEKMKDAFLLHQEGYDAFLLVYRYGSRFTREDKNVTEVIKSIFGENIIHYFSIIILTHGDVYRSHKTNKNKTIKTWCSEQKGVFKEILDECGHRVVLFDNNTDDPNIKDEQMKNLIKEIQDLQDKAKRYTNYQFTFAERNRTILIMKCKKERITGEIRKEGNMLIEKMKSLESLEFDEQIQVLNIIFKKSEELKKKILKLDEEKGVYKEAIEIASNVNVMIHSQLIMANKQKLIKEKDDQIKALRTEYEKKIKKYEEMFSTSAEEQNKIKEVFILH